MSTTFRIACPETHKAVWIGQGSSNNMRTFYSGEPETMEKLGKFLNAHLGKMLVVVNDNHWILDDCKEWGEDDDEGGEDDNQ